MTNKKLKIGKAPNPKYDKIQQAIHTAKTEAEKIKWRAVLAALEARDSRKD